jgi:phospholipid:diacylglycerol acyltransferase
MSALRRRLFGAPQDGSSREESPARAEEVRLAPVSKIMKAGAKHDKSKKRHGGFIFFLGGLFGIVAAGFFARKNDLIDFPEFADLGMTGLLDVLPAGFVKDARDLAVQFNPSFSLLS